MTTIDERISALAKFLGEEDLSKFSEDNNYENGIEYDNAETYLVLTDEEANEKVAEEIKNTLWAFHADFIIQHCKNYDDMGIYEVDAAIESLQKAQENQCENLNGLVYALIDDIDEFIENAVIADGRGHFISSYDGKENEQDSLYIYRVE